MKLEVQNLEKFYRQGDSQLHILKGVNLNLFEGEVVAVLGKSGSGKTTLLSLLAGLDQPDGGQIMMGSQAFSKLSEDDRTAFRGQQIGIVFQSYHLVPHLSALENVMLPLEILNQENAAQRARQLLEDVGLGHRLNHFPSQLSGGESQRTALARALVTNPRLLLADEPSGHLDQETGQTVMDLFFRIVREKKMTTLLVTHDSALAERCDRQVRLQNGVI